MTVPQLVEDGNSNPIQALSIGAAQQVAYTATPGQSAALNTRVVRVVSTTSCHLKVGTNPAAAVTDTYLPANVIEYIKINVGEKISAIQVSAGGTLHITELS